MLTIVMIHIWDLKIVDQKLKPIVAKVLVREGFRMFPKAEEIES